MTRIPVQAGAVVDRDTVTVGDVVHLVVRVRAPRGATVNFPSAVDSLGPVQSLEPPTVRDGSDTLDFTDRVATYALAAWDIGTQPIRLGEVLVQTDDDERRVQLTLPSLIVRSVLPADTTLRIPKPARPLLPVRAPTPWWWWLLAASASRAPRPSSPPPLWPWGSASGGGGAAGLAHCHLQATPMAMRSTSSIASRSSGSSKRESLAATPRS